MPYNPRICRFDWVFCVFCKVISVREWTSERGVSVRRYSAFMLCVLCQNSICVCSSLFLQVYWETLLNKLRKKIQGNDYNLKLHFGRKKNPSWCVFVFVTELKRILFSLSVTATHLWLNFAEPHTSPNFTRKPTLVTVTAFLRSVLTLSADHCHDGNVPSVTKCAHHTVLGFNNTMADGGSGSSPHRARGGSKHVPHAQGGSHGTPGAHGAGPRRGSVLKVLDSHHGSRRRSSAASVSHFGWVHVH